MGRTPMLKTGRILHLKSWQDARQAVALPANFHCQKCGTLCFLTGPSTGEGDHKIPRRVLAETGGDPLALDNLQWFCKPCHARKSILDATRQSRRKPQPMAPPSPQTIPIRTARGAIPHQGPQGFPDGCGAGPSDIIR